MKLQTLLFVAITLGLAGGASLAADWPQWRGSNRDGKSADNGLLKQWPAEGPALAWRVGGLGKGYSSVAVAEGRIFTMGDRDGGSAVICLAESDGKELWVSKLGDDGGHNRYPGTRSTPTVAGGQVFVLNQHGDLGCVDAKSGKRIWSRNLEKDFGGKMMSGWRYSESPLVDGDRVVCTPGGGKGAMVALDRRTGKTLWQSARFTDPAGYSSIMAVKLCDADQYVQWTGNSVVGINPVNGDLLWQAERKGKTAVIPTPVIRDNLVYVSSGYGVGCNLFSVTRDSGGFKAEEVYQNQSLKNHHGGLILIGDHVYGSSDPGILTCMEMKTGKVVWEDRSVGKGALSFADGHLYLRDEGRGTVALVEATPAGYREKGRLQQPDRAPEKAWAHPVIANGMLYLRDQDNLFCYRVSAK